MYRLAQLDDRQRTRMGSAALLVGTIVFVVGFVWAHYALFPETVVIDGVEEVVEVDYLGWVPRGWQWFTLGQAVSFGGSQLVLAGAAIVWLLNKEMTWARAGFAAFLAWVELILLFGVVPSEWLNLTQGPLGWTKQRIAFTVPRWLVLGNTVEISWSVIKDAVSGAYHILMMGVAIIAALKLQDINKEPVSGVKPARLSSYGRPLVKGDA